MRTSHPVDRALFLAPTVHELISQGYRLMPATQSLLGLQITGEPGVYRDRSVKWSKRQRTKMHTHASLLDYHWTWYSAERMALCVLHTKPREKKGKGCSTMKSPWSPLKKSPLRREVSDPSIVGCT